MDVGGVVTVTKPLVSVAVSGVPWLPDSPPIGRPSGGALFSTAPSDVTTEVDVGGGDAVGEAAVVSATVDGSAVAVTLVSSGTCVLVLFS